MSKEVVLVSERRDVIGKQVKELRRQGLLPAVVYGAGIEPTPIQLNSQDAEKILVGVGSSTLIDLHVGDEVYKVLVRDLQRDVIRRNPIHIDFLKVAMDVIISTVVPVELVGQSPAVQELGGVLVTGLSEIEVEALPSDLPDRVTVDLELLKNFDDTITVGDLYLGDGVTVLTDPDEFIANVVYQTMEEIVEEEEELEAELAEPELVGVEGEEGVEGEAPAEEAQEE
ncbi:MAG: 50S ribosomal protein L25 [Anaerolineales bacterium]|nr:50S ribosomal protein L25 [Anaerolineales bacterium]